VQHERFSVLGCKTKKEKKILNFIPGVEFKSGIWESLLQETEETTFTYKFSRKCIGGIRCNTKVFRITSVCLERSTTCDYRSLKNLHPNWKWISMQDFTCFWRTHDETLVWYVLPEKNVATSSLIVCWPDNVLNTENKLIFLDEHHGENSLRIINLALGQLWGVSQGSKHGEFIKQF